MKRIYAEGLIAPDEDRDMLEMFGFPCITPRMLRWQLDQAKNNENEDIELWINCYGGDVWAAMAMYADLQSYEGNTTAFVTGLSASASTVLMLGCKTVKASIGAQFMIHNAQSEADGDYHDMYTAAEQLKTGNDGILAVYIKKTGQDYSKLKNLMERTTWLSASEAQDLGFVDEIEHFENERLVAGAVNINNLRTKYAELKQAGTKEIERENPNEENKEETLPKEDLKYEEELLKIEMERKYA